MTQSSSQCPYIFDFGEKYPPFSGPPRVLTCLVNPDYQGPVKSMNKYLSYLMRKDFNKMCLIVAIRFGEGITLDNLDLTSLNYQSNFFLYFEDVNLTEDFDIKFSEKTDKYRTGRCEQIDIETEFSSSTKPEVMKKITQVLSNRPEPAESFEDY